MLADRPASFSEILDSISVDSGHLSYHLESLGELIRKPQDGKYELSSIGVAAVKLMSGVEEHQTYSPGKESRMRLTAVNVLPLIFAVVLIGASFVSFAVPLRAESQSTSPGTFIHVRPGETVAFNLTVVYTAGMECAVLTNNSLYHERSPPISTVTVWEEGAFWFDLTSNETYSIVFTVFRPDGSSVTGIEYYDASYRAPHFSQDLVLVPVDSILAMPTTGLGLGLTSFSQPGKYILEIQNIGVQDLHGLLAFHERWQFLEKPWFFYGVACFLLVLPYLVWIVMLIVKKPHV
jgi:hypothetical protein